MKKFWIIALALTMLITVTACGSTTAATTEATAAPADEPAVTAEPIKNDELSQSEQENIDIVSNDMTIITDDNYVEVMTELMNHTGEFTGYAYQLEGVYSTENFTDAACVMRTVKDGDNSYFCGIPLTMNMKDFNDGDWISVTGIISVNTIDGTEMNTLDVLAIQLCDAGNAVLNAQ